MRIYFMRIYFSSPFQVHKAGIKSSKPFATGTLLAVATKDLNAPLRFVAKTRWRHKAARALKIYYRKKLQTSFTSYNRKFEINCFEEIIAKKAGKNWGGGVFKYQLL